MKISNCCSAQVKNERDNEGVCMTCGEHCEVEEEDNTYQKTCPKGHTAIFDSDMDEKYCMCGEKYKSEV